MRDLMQKLRDVVLKPTVIIGLGGSGLACIDELGMEGTLQAANGMFALAVWDTHQQALSLARDRLGKKPLHYCFAGDRLLFASEIKAILGAHPEQSISPSAIEAFFALSYIPAPLTIWKDIRKLPPASWMQIGSDLSFEERSYWDFKKSKCSSARTFHEQAENANALLQDAVKRRLVGDVPLVLRVGTGWKVILR